MADDATTASAQAQAVGDELLKELQAAVSGQGSEAVALAVQQAIQNIKQIAEDTYWTPRRQMEEAINTRNTAAARVAAAEERIAQLKQQVGT